MRKQSLYVLYVCFALIMQGVIFAIDGVGEVNFQSLVASDVTVERELFLKCWMAEYQSCSLGELQLQSVPKFLHEQFDKELAMLQKDSQEFFFVRAVVKNSVIGWISFEVDKARQVYVRQWALQDAFYTKEYLSELLFAVFDYVPDAGSVSFCLRDCAVQAISYISSLGFELVSDQYDDLDSEKYSCFKMMSATKCGTCGCDISEEDLAADMMWCGCDSSDEFGSDSSSSDFAGGADFCSISGGNCS